MYNKLDATYRSNDPQLIDVAYPQVDVIQAYYDHDRRRLAIALAPASEPTGPTGFSVNNLKNGQVYRVTVDGKEIATGRGMHLTSSDPTIAIAWRNMTDLQIRIDRKSTRVNSSHENEPRIPC